MPPKQKKQRVTSTAASSNDDEDLFSSGTARRPGSRAASTARAPPKAPSISLTIWTKPGMKQKLTGSIDKQIEYQATWETVKPIVMEGARLFLEDFWSLDGCKFYWLGRTRHRTAALSVIWSRKECWRRCRSAKAGSNRM